MDHQTGGVSMPPRKIGQELSKSLSSSPDGAETGVLGVSRLSSWSENVSRVLGLVSQWLMTNKLHV